MPDISELESAAAELRIALCGAPAFVAAQMRQRLRRLEIQIEEAHRQAGAPALAWTDE
jgi:hypothetical protein